MKNPLKQWFDKANRGKNNELSQTKMAESLGVPHQTVWNWLNDKTKPAGDKLQGIHRLTGIDPKVLIDWAADGNKDDL